MALHFEPVAPDAAQDGQYLLFDWLGPTLLTQMSRALHLDHIKARLLYCLAARLAGDPSPRGIARKFCGKEDVETVRKRYTRLQDYASSFDGSEKRKNGIVSTCLEHLSKHTSLVATLFYAPIWEIVSRGHWSLRELEAMRDMVESMGVDIPDDPTDEFSACCFYFSLCQPGVHGAPTIWAAANVTAFCMARAQAVGDLVAYGVAYDAMIFHARESRMAQGADVLTLMMRDFWMMFVRFVRLWHSRVKVAGLSEYDRKSVARLLRAHSVEVYWQVISSAPQHAAARPKLVTRGGLRLVYSEECVRAHCCRLGKRVWRIPAWRARLFAPKPLRKVAREEVRYRGIKVESDPQTFSLNVELSDRTC
ncbi:hypothetical protein G3N95_25065 [Paraburkholderia sp. Tr-20389]|uniref:hypothetical protein n=1 Tax=Paraburkholderia sp. Tr-20389 TaxID=2703903 RepID=UPI00197E30D4|nr:hypothetical protein [Paraburkholderia sp. Tr-20389]MBN3756234.1 hypothetical protein [Paraburkholderia sp. Tr-20389]